jgi:hypothetical protein
MCVGPSGSKDLDESLTDANIGCRSRVALGWGAFSSTSRNSCLHPPNLIFFNSDIPALVKKLQSTFLDIPALYVPIHPRIHFIPYLTCRPDQVHLLRFGNPFITIPPPRLQRPLGLHNHNTPTNARAALTQFKTPNVDITSKIPMTMNDMLADSTTPS